jgi:predicted ATPase/DNA-binding SARP family transcriptional activator/Tfp pilus assembly protein PilF
MSLLRIHCLGDFRVEIAKDKILNFDTEKTRALLAYLAVESDKPLRRSYLVGLLWPDEPEERALHSLRQTLSRLRKVLGENLSKTLILTERDTIQLNPLADIWVDTRIFTDWLDKAYRFYRSQKGQGFFHFGYLKRAVAVYEGQFLEQIFLNKCDLFQEWSLLMREKYNMQAIKAFSLLAGYHERRCEYQLALQAALRIVALAPWDETAHAQVIYLLGLDNQWSAAQCQFLAHKKYLAEQLGVEPSKDVMQLFQQVREAASGNSTLDPRLPAYPYILPDSFSAFIGRENELDEIMEMITNPGQRLITLVGPGGIGKTQLALELAHQLVGVFADGVFFISFVAAQMPAQILPFIAEALSLVFSEEAELQTKLFDHLRNKEMLLVLDNWEHLLSFAESTSLLDDLLRLSAQITILVTSRERLNLQQENLFVLSGLSYPQNDEILPEDAGDYDSLCLFEHRAVQMQRDFVLNNTNLPFVLRICRILDGLPLGIELAAAIVFEKGYEYTAKQIGNDLDVLTTRITNLPVRHRNLRAAFDVSWDLLKPKEQTVLSRLSMFRGGFDRHAAQQIANAGAGILSTMVAKSLVQMNSSQRFYLHEAIRQFAAEKLENHIDYMDVQQSHARYYAAFLARKNPDLKQAGQPQALADIQQEFGNINLMWNWLVEHTCIPEIIACQDSLYQFFSVRSLTKEGLHWFDVALQKIEYAPNTELAQAMLLARLGALAYTARELPRAQSALLRSQEILLRHDAGDELAFCRLCLGWTFYRTKDFSAAQETVSQSLDYFRCVEDALGESEALSVLGSICLKQGKQSEAKALFEEVLRLSRKTGNPRQLVQTLNRLGDLSCYDGHYDLAVSQFEESLVICRQLNDRYNQAILLNNLGTIYHVRNDYAQAEEFYQKSLQICREIGDQDGIALALNNLGELATQQAHYPAAIRYSEEALKIANQLQENWTIIACLNSLGEIYSHMRQLEKSQDYYIRAIRLALEIDCIDLVARVSVNLARVCQLIGDKPNAVALFRSAIAHPATEHDLREKAIGWLKEMEIDASGEADDQLLLPLVTAYLSEEKNYQ